jgi:ribonucleoside-diphosphate reductase alpha chain
VTRQPRPDGLPSKTHEVRTGCEKVYVIVSTMNGRPFEVFVRGAENAAGGCQCSQNEALGRLVSLALREGISVEDVVKQIVGIHCAKASLGGTSCPDAVAKVLRRYVNAEADAKGTTEENAGGQPQA